jgi:uncharacterized protein involved in exopolysaccharide biosynthesis
MRRELDLARESYSQIALNLETALLEEKRTTPGVLMLLPPTVPAEHAFPKRRATVLLTMLGAVMLAWAGFFISDHGMPRW